MKLFGYSISLNVLILIGILYLIMTVNALSGSCNMEGLITMSNAKQAQQAASSQMSAAQLTLAKASQQMCKAIQAVSDADKAAALPGSTASRVTSGRVAAPVTKIVTRK